MEDSTSSPWRTRPVPGRNLKDWADLGELIDAGIEVHFANESLDLHSRGGRLSADIQAVVAADYIRNLREETKKGFYGRLKQGLYPRPAPVGYLNVGKGKAKSVDPVQAPLVRKAFELYSTGQYNLKRLALEMYNSGLRGRRGQKISLNGLSLMLKNPFYMGLIQVKKVKETYAGLHQPLVSKALFDRVQQVLHGKVVYRSNRHEYLFRRLIRCELCHYRLIGEEQKAVVYYRCHTKGCPTATVREDAIEQNLVDQLRKLEFSKEEKKYFFTKVRQLGGTAEEQQQKAIQTIELQLNQIQDRLNRLTDVFLDQAIDRETFEQRKTALLHEHRSLEDKLVELRRYKGLVVNKLTQFLELAGGASLLYQTALPEEKRELVQIVTSNRTLEGKTLRLMLSLPFLEVANRCDIACGSPKRSVALVWNRLLKSLQQYFHSNELYLPEKVNFPYVA